MTLRRHYLKILAAIASVGAVGVSPLLGSLASAANEDAPEPLRSDREARVAERLAAIRGAVSDAADSDKDDHGAGGQQLAWWGNWRNGGGSAGAWRNGGWRNGGWGNGGWRNGPVWRNAPWRNFWRNW